MLRNIHIYPLALALAITGRHVDNMLPVVPEVAQIAEISPTVLARRSQPVALAGCHSLRICLACLPNPGRRTAFHHALPRQLL